jgi:hypothetical protein
MYSCVEQVAGALREEMAANTVPNWLELRIEIKSHGGELIASGIRTVESGPLQDTQAFELTLERLGQLTPLWNTIVSEQPQLKRVEAVMNRSYSVCLKFE